VKATVIMWVRKGAVTSRPAPVAREHRGGDIGRRGGDIGKRGGNIGKLVLEHATQGGETAREESAGTLLLSEVRVALEIE
jgi:hypothetical protein